MLRQQGQGGPCPASWGQSQQAFCSKDFGRSNTPALLAPCWLTELCYGSEAGSQCLNSQWFQQTLSTCNMLSNGLIQHGILSAISLSGICSLARAIREPSLRNLRLVSVLLQVQWFVGFTSLYSSLCTGLVCSCVWSDYEWEGSGIWLGPLPREIFQAHEIPCIF